MQKLADFPKGTNLTLQKGRPRAHVLPHRHAVRAERSAPAADRSRVHGHPKVRAVDDPADVRKDDDGVWHVEERRRRCACGSECRALRGVTTWRSSTRPRRFEPMNPCARGVRAHPQDRRPPKSPYCVVARHWYEHRTCATSGWKRSLSPMGRRVRLHVRPAARRRPGDFVVAPPKARGDVHAGDLRARGGDRVSWNRRGGVLLKGACRKLLRKPTTELKSAGDPGGAAPREGAGRRPTRASRVLLEGLPAWESEIVRARRRAARHPDDDPGFEPPRSRPISVGLRS